MLIYNTCLLNICLFLDFSSFSKMLLYLPIHNKEYIAKQYCIENSIFNNLCIDSYSKTLVYLNNNKTNRCFICNNPIIDKYYLLVCTCVTECVKKNRIIYIRSHLDCFNKYNFKNNKYFSDNKQINNIKCPFCNKQRFLLKCNIYS